MSKMKMLEGCDTGWLRHTHTCPYTYMSKRDHSASLPLAPLSGTQVSDKGLTEVQTSPNKGWWGCAPLLGSSASLPIGHRCFRPPSCDRGLTEVLTSPNKFAQDRGERWEVWGGAHSDLAGIQDITTWHGPLQPQPPLRGLLLNPVTLRDDQR